MKEKIIKQIERFKEKPAKQQVLIILPYAVVMFFCIRLAELYRLCQGNLNRMLTNIAYIYKAFPRFNLTDILIGIGTGFIIVYFIKWYNMLHHKNERRGEEYGSSRWGTAEDIKPFIDEDPFNNLIFSMTERLSMKPRMKKFNLNRNKHVVVYGGSGAGKTYAFVKPNLYQLYGSYVLTDPNGLVC